MTMKQSSQFLDRFDFRVDYLASRGAKAEKILKVLRREFQDIAHVSLLDVGCSQGQITGRLSKDFGFVVGIDIDPERTRAFHFVQADGCRLPIVSSRFDVVLLNHVLEHVSWPEKLLTEVWRVLKPVLQPAGARTSKILHDCPAAQPASSSVKIHRTVKSVSWAWVLSTDAAVQRGNTPRKLVTFSSDRIGSRSQRCS